MSLLAALRALENGDEENAWVAVTPGGIEAQERRGQSDFVTNDTLPIQCGYGTTPDQIIALGVQYGEPVDDLFVAVKLPEGWHKEATDHSMHNNLLDDKGRVRARIFYKAAFYDRRADISLIRRYTCGTEPVGGYKEDNEDAPYCGYVRDQATGENIWQSENTVDQPNWDGPRETALALMDAKDELGGQAERWLNEHYPDWKNPLAYW